MQPYKKGWVNEYITWFLDVQKQQKFNVDSSKKPVHLDHDRRLYKTVQPTGLMYGHPVSTSSNIHSFSKWSDQERMKFVLLDSLVNDSIIIHADDIQNQEDLQECVQNTMTQLEEFYSGPASRAAIPANRSKSTTEKIELIMNKRIGVRTFWRKDFWNRFFQNSLLFLDVYFFGRRLQDKNGESDLKLFQEQQENLRLDILKIIASAAKANHNIEDEEKALFTFFLQSAGLSKDNELLAKGFLEDDVDLNSIDFDRYDSWIIKKYMLELAILTVWADRRLEETEKKFVEELTAKLKITKPELERSLLAIESFVITNWGQIHFLQTKHNLLIIKDRFYDRLKGVLNRNKKAIIQEVNESKELMDLLHKMTRVKLSEEEKFKVKIQLMDIIKTLPTFIIIALPGTFITLPLLLNILPKKAFPSAFSEID